MIYATAERSPEYEQLYQYAQERAELGTSGSGLLNVVRMFNHNNGLNLPLETVEEICKTVTREDIPESKQEATQPEDFKTQFHHFNDKGKCTGVFDFRILEYIKERDNLFVLGAVPYHFRHGVYVADLSGAVLKTAIRDLIYPEQVKSTVIERVFRLFIQDADLQVKADELNRYPPEWINFRNGMFDPVTGEMIPHSPGHRSINQIPWEYHPEEKLSGDAIESWLRFITPDPEDREMLLQFVGYCLTRDTRMQKFLVLNGTGGSGKSTLIRMIETLIGEDNLSHVSLKELGQRFSSFGLMGKLVNSCADLEISALEDTSVLKKCLGEDSLRGESKGRDAISFKSYAKLIFSCNELPLILSERTNGFYRRLMVLTMDRQPETARADYLDVLQAETDYFIHLAVDALRRMYADGRIHESPSSQEAVRMLRNDSDSVEAFLNARTERSQDGRIKKADLYREYESFCREGERQSLTKQNFYRSMRSKGFGEIKSGGTEFFKGVSWKEFFPSLSREISLTDWTGLPEGENPFIKGWKRERKF